MLLVSRTAASPIGAIFSPCCEREFARIGGELAAAKGLPFRAASDGETVSGRFSGTVQLSSGKFALVSRLTQQRRSEDEFVLRRQG